MSTQWLSSYLEMMVDGILRGLSKVMDIVAPASFERAEQFVGDAIKNGDFDLYLLRARHYGSGDFKLRGFRLLNVRAPNGRRIARTEVVRARRDMDDPIQQGFPIGDKKYVREPF